VLLHPGECYPEFYQMGFDEKKLECILLSCIILSYADYVFLLQVDLDLLCLFTIFSYNIHS